MKSKALIFSAPSGSGKTTIVKHLIYRFPELSFSISATSRSPRSNEENGKDYYFLTLDAFHHAISAEELLEYEEVYKGRYYGTLKREVERIWSENKVVVFDVDVVGGVNLKKKLGEKALAIFIKVSDLSILEHRLDSRGTEDVQSLHVRVDKARHEMTYESQFDLTLINDNLEEALKSAEKIVEDFISS